MASLTCIFCGAENADGEQLCRACFRKLPVAASPQVAHQPAPQPVVATDPAPTPATCPHCGEEVPDRRNRVCVGCHRPLSRAEPVRLSFSDGEVTVEPARPVRLGRDPASSPVAGLFSDRGNISRLHATVGVDENGAWVRDERSLNGTYVNDVPVPPGSRIGLADGDTLRLAADVAATVRHPGASSPATG